MDQSAPTLDQRVQGFCAMLQCGTRGAEGTERSAHLGRTDPQWPAPVARSRSRTAGGAGRTRKLVGEGGLAACERSEAYPVQSPNTVKTN